MASLTITDHCGTEVTANIRNETDSDWETQVAFNDICVMSGVSTDSEVRGAGRLVTRIVGDKKQEIQVDIVGGSPDECDGAESCPDPSTHAACCAGPNCDTNGLASESPCLTDVYNDGSGVEACTCVTLNPGNWECGTLANLWYALWK